MYLTDHQIMSNNKIETEMEIWANARSDAVEISRASTLVVRIARRPDLQKIETMTVPVVLQYFVLVTLYELRRMSRGAKCRMYDIRT
jgi:hypothetical protein